MTPYPPWLGPSLARGVALLGKTWRVDLQGDLPTPHDNDPRRIYAVWHGRMLPLTAARQHVLAASPLTIMTSQTRDGALQASILATLGIDTVVGSSLGRGPRALLELARALERGASACLAVDGPAGPVFCAKSGAAALSMMTGVPIIPVGAIASPGWTIPETWDHMVLPLPGARVTLRLGDPILDPGTGPKRIRRAQMVEDLQKQLAALNHTHPVSLRVASPDNDL